MPQHKDALEHLVKAFDDKVQVQNEIDFCALVKLNGFDEDNPFLISCQVKNKSRPVDFEQAKKVAALKAQIYQQQPFSKYRIEENDTNMTAWLPVWDDRSVEQRKLYAGCFVLYISATPVGRDVFNAAIQLKGGELISLAKRFLDL